MHLKSTILLFIFTILGLTIDGQGLHFTQFHFAPLTVNPALAGAYSGSYRIGGIYRDQYRSVATNAFQTLNFMADAPIIRGLRKQDWIGIGLGSTVFDQAGVAGFKETFFRLNGAYHLSLDKKQTRIFTIGLQMNSANVSVNTITSDDTRGGSPTTDPDVELFNQRAQMGEVSEGYSDYVLGLMYNSRGKNSDLKFGISAARILGPDLRIGPSRDELDLRLILFGMMTTQMNEKTSFTPAVFAQFQGPAREIVAQGRIGYLIKPDKGIKLNAGLGYRIGDAAQIMAGVDIKDLRFGVSYDMTLSGLNPAANYMGGFELAVSYLGKIFTKPKIKPIIVCPRL